MDSRRHTIPNFYPSQDGEPLSEQPEFNRPESSLPFDHGGPRNDQEIIVIDTYNILDFLSSYGSLRPYELVSTGYPVEDQWEGNEGWRSEPQASTSQALPFINNASQELDLILPWFPDVGTTANPQDVWDFSASTSSINYMVDERKPVYEYRGSPPAPSNLNSTYYPLPSEPETDRGSINHQESGAGSSSATVRDSNFEAQNCLLGQDGSRSGNQVTSSSSVITSTKSIKGSIDDDDHSQDLVDVNGDYQIEKPKRKDGRSQCPYSKCSRHFKRAGGRNRHVKSACHLNILGRKCPKPYCLFEGARSDVVTRHLRERGHKNESGQCTCGADACERARGSKRARKE